MGHTVRLIPPQYVKPFVKRGKNNRNDAEAIGEARRFRFAKRRASRLPCVSCR